MCRGRAAAAGGYFPAAGNEAAPVSVLLPANSPEYHRPGPTRAVATCRALR